VHIKHALYAYTRVERKLNVGEYNRCITSLKKKETKEILLHPSNPTVAIAELDRKRSWRQIYISNKREKERESVNAFTLVE